MKKPILVVALLIIVPLSVSAQGFYFDAGIGIGFIPTWDIEWGYYYLNGELKAGYGPFGNIPIYAVSEVKMKVPSPSFGAGAIFYPTRFIQLSTFLGYVSSVDGFEWDISTAIDFGKKNHGFLIGLQYFGMTFQENNKPDIFDNFGIFVKYAYRKKVPKQTVTANVITNDKKISSRQSNSNSGITETIVRASQGLINDLPGNTRIAVINISSNNGNLSTQIVDELEFQLVSSKKFTIVNRNALDAIRREQNFQMSGEVSDESVVSIGQLLGANIVITGTINETGTSQRLIIRALDVKTAEIVAMVREEF